MNRYARTAFSLGAVAGGLVGGAGILLNRDWYFIWAWLMYSAGIECSTFCVIGYFAAFSLVGALGGLAIGSMWQRWCGRWRKP
jgi:hypothetical protein